MNGLCRCIIDRVRDGFTYTLDQENINTVNIQDYKKLNSKSRNNEDTVKAIIKKYKVDSKPLKDHNHKDRQFYSFIEKSK